MKKVADSKATGETVVIVLDEEKEAYFKLRDLKIFEIVPEKFLFEAFAIKQLSCQKMFEAYQKVKSTYEIMDAKGLTCTLRITEWWEIEAFIDHPKKYRDNIVHLKQFSQLGILQGNAFSMLECNRKDIPYAQLKKVLQPLSQWLPELTIQHWWQLYALLGDVENFNKFFKNGDSLKRNEGESPSKKYVFAEVGTPVHWWALARNFDQALASLEKFGGQTWNFTTATKFGMTPIMLAAFSQIFQEGQQSECEFIAKAIARFGDNVNLFACDSFGRSVLNYATMAECKPTIKLLIQNGCRVSIKHLYYTADDNTRWIFLATIGLQYLRETGLTINQGRDAAWRSGKSLFEQVCALLNYYRQPNEGVLNKTLGFFSNTYTRYVGAAPPVEVYKKPDTKPGDDTVDRIIEDLQRFTTENVLATDIQVCLEFKKKLQNWLGSYLNARAKLLLEKYSNNYKMPQGLKSVEAYLCQHSEEELFKELPDEFCGYLAVAISNVQSLILKHQAGEALDVNPRLEVDQNNDFLFEDSLLGDGDEIDFIVKEGETFEL